MLGKLVHTTTQDGIRLDGWMSYAPKATQAWMLVHGVNSNFYSSSLLREIAEAFANDETAVVLVNTRGHDILSFNTGPTPVRLGSQIEVIHAAEQDITAWMQQIKRMGIANIGLIGHSLGALKCALWATQHPQELQKFIALSPPRLCTELLLSDPNRGSVFQEHLEQAKSWCDQGKPEHVMKVRFPMPMWVCAATYLDKYGSGDKYDYLNMAPLISVPTLWTFGQIEVERGSVNFRNAHQALEHLILQSKDVAGWHQIRVIEGGDHSYHQVREPLIHSLQQWLS